MLPFAPWISLRDKAMFCVFIPFLSVLCKIHNKNVGLQNKNVGKPTFLFCILGHIDYIFKSETLRQQDY